MGPLFAKVDINLDSHPKVRKAGRDGREVFLFVLRKNAALQRDGFVPASYVDPDYLAEQLMVTKEEACHGLSRCVAAGLLAVTSENVSISGWDGDWGTRAMSDAERKAKQRARSTIPTTSDVSSPDVTFGHEGDRDDRDCHVEEKRREEKKRGEEETALDPPLPKKPDRAEEIADLAVCEINLLAGSRFSPLTKSTRKNSKALAKGKRTDEEILLVIRSKTEWIGDGKMHQHFCPDTLLGPENFDRYLDKARGGSPVRAGPKTLRLISDSDEPDLSHAGLTSTKP
jgi:uncharacterized phage protein (TIGR02220 family)